MFSNNPAEDIFSILEDGIGYKIYLVFYYQQFLAHKVHCTIDKELLI